MNSFINPVERKTTDEKLKFYIQDDENTMMYRPQDMHGKKLFGTWSKLMSINEMLNMEI